MTQSILIALFSVTALFSLFGKKKASVSLFIIILAIQVLIVTFRPDSMADYANYANAYKYGADRFEPIYQGLFNILHQIDYGELSLFFCMALLTIGIKGCALWRMSTLPILSLVVWISDIMIIQDMIAIRAALASAFLVLVIYYKIKQKPLYMWISFALAICCHFSALILLVVPFLSTKKMYRKGYMVALLASLTFPLVNFSVFDYLPVLSQNYQLLIDMYSNQQSANPYNLMILARCLICLALWIKMGKISELNRYFLIATKTYTLGCILFYMFHNHISVAFRLGELFWVTEIIVLPYLLYLVGSKYKSFGKLIPIAVSVALLCINISSELYWNVN